MKCTLDYDKMLAYCLGELTGREADEVGRHIASCPRCAREVTAMDELSRSLASLPRMDPGAGRWGELSNAIEREQQGGAIRLLVSVIRNVRRPAVAAGASLMLLCALVLYLSARREVDRSDTAIEEMGSTIAHVRPEGQKFSDAMDSYLHDARIFVAELSGCVASGDAGCWMALKDKIIRNDMLYKAIYLHEQLSGVPGDARAGLDESRALIDDSSNIFRAISERSPERLVSEGSALEERVTRMDLPGRLKKGGGR